MSAPNEVYQVLVADNTLACLAAGSEVSALSHGQIGVFDSNTGLSIDGTSPSREFFIAVGVNPAGSGVMSDLSKSAGQKIQTRNISGFTYREHTAAQPEITEITGFKASCDADYAVKLEFRNQQIYRRQGFNQYTKTYAIRTACCEGCEGCPSGDCVEIAKLMVANMNDDVDNLITAVSFATEPLTIVTHGTSTDYAINDEITLVADLDALMTFNAAQTDLALRVCVGIKITTSPLAVQSFCTINTNYFNPRGTTVITSLISGFACNGTKTITQNIAFEEGNGYDVLQKEFHAGGWNAKPGPYRVNTVSGLPAAGFNYMASANEKYDVFNLSYDLISQAGWDDMKGNLATDVAFKIDGATVLGRNTFVAVIDGLTVPLGFDALEDDVTASTQTTTTVSPTEAKTVATEGIA
ncbi:hypothetical protein N9933_01200 [bacterium]|nr:hypothetical protein [bacterium]